MDKLRARYGILEFTEAVLGIKPYQWQRQALCNIAAGYPTALVAANGSDGSLSPTLLRQQLQVLERS